jgi:hypothetical protein
MKHIEIAEQRVVGGWLRLLNLFGWNVFFSNVIVVKDKSPIVPFHGITSPYNYFEEI